MNVDVKLYGKIADIVGKESETVSIIIGSDKTPTTVEQLLVNRYSMIDQETLKSASVAINNEFKNLQTEINDGDQIALMPAFAGG